MLRELKDHTKKGNEQFDPFAGTSWVLFGGKWRDEAECEQLDKGETKIWNRKQIEWWRDRSVAAHCTNQFKFKTVGSQTCVFDYIGVFSNRPFTKANMGRRGCILPQGVFALLWPIIGSSFNVQHTTYPRIWVLRGNLITTYPRINNKSIQQQEYSTYSIKNQFNSFP